MSARAIIQVVLSGTKIVGRAFVDAYKVAAAEAAQNRSAVKSDADEVTKKTGITIDEACQILNVEKDSPLESIIKRYETLFEINDPKKGGSFYLQSKIYRAKERIEMELKNLDNNIEKDNEKEKEQTN
ncbi:protein transporter [Neoconidiobolus thromboides FSU 785]|nr:protein transporter [Neoconidiobolus thromboides FSU 785]